MEKRADWLIRLGGGVGWVKLNSIDGCITSHSLTSYVIRLRSEMSAAHVYASNIILQCFRRCKSFCSRYLRVQ